MTIDVNWRRDGSALLDNWRHAERWKRATGPKQTVEEYLAAGGQITNCPRLSWRSGRPDAGSRGG